MDVQVNSTKRMYSAHLQTEIWYHKYAEFCWKRVLIIKRTRAQKNKKLKYSLSETKKKNTMITCDNRDWI